MKRPLILLALVALTLLPVAAFGFGTAGYSLLSQIGPLDVAEKLGDKSMATWFLALAVVAIGSWTWVFKWMITQLDAQRAANAALVDKLLEAHKTENSTLRDLLEK